MKISHVSISLFGYKLAIGNVVMSFQHVNRKNRLVALEYVNEKTCLIAGR